MKKKLKDVLKCLTCGESFIPDEEAVIFHTDEWNGHTYKYDCTCVQTRT